MALSTPAFDPDRLSIEALDEEIVSLTARLTMTEYELLTLIRTFDERGGWLKWGSASCAEWLHWRCDLSLSAAREKVRVAHALKVLPEISTAFADGRLSYSKVRALTRAANRHNEAALLAFALNVSAALVEERCRQLRNTAPDAHETSRLAYERRSLSAFRDRGRGVMSINVEIPIEDGELVLNALDKVLADTAAPADASTSYRVRQADALVALCRGALAEQGNPSAEGCDASDISAPTRPAAATDSYQVVVHVDERALRGERSADADPSAEGRADLPVETVRRLCCDGMVIPIRDGENGTPLSLGRKRRTISTALKRALLSRDVHCRFPGCTHARFVDAHHVQHWALGGETSLENLMLLCSHHHRLVHEGGFRIITDHEGKRFFRRPDGRAVPASGYRVEDTTDTHREILAVSSEASAETSDIGPT